MSALDGLRVLDLSGHRTGAQATQLLADFGADVLWVEPPGGSLLRKHPGFPFLARGKRNVEIDLRSPDGSARVAALAKEADVLLETFRPGVADRLGLGFDVLSQSNPRLVYASITGFGREGPNADLQGYEGLVMAKLGVLAAYRKLAGGAHPVYVSVPWCSFAATQVALQGILAALLDRRATGLGQRVEANLALGFASLDTWAWYLDLITDRYPGAYLPAEVFDENGIPASPSVYRLLVALTKDGRWLQFAQARDHLFAALIRALDLEALLKGPEWKSAPDLDDPAMRRELWLRMLEAVRSKSVAEWQLIFDADPDVFAELFRDGPEVLTHPQLVHDRQVVDIVDAERGRVRQPGPLIDCEVTPAELGRPAPARPGESPAAWLQADTARAAFDEVAGRSTTRMPLEGTVVVEFASVFATPYGAALLTDLGARVVKVEPVEGDPVRHIAAFPEAGGARATQGKESICVDVTTPDGLAIARQLAATADIVIYGYRAGSAKRLGLDAATLRAGNPDLVYLNATGYGTGGPDGHRPAFAPSIAAAGGAARANVGDSVRESADLTAAEVCDGAIRLAAGAAIVQAQVDGFAALTVVVAALLGLLAREHNGGQEVSTSMLVTTAHAMADYIVDSDDGPEPVRPDSALLGLGALYRIYAASDGWVFLAAPCEHEWSKLAAALRPYVDLDRFGDPAFRREHDADLARTLAGVFGTRTKDAWERHLRAADVGCAAVWTGAIERVLKSEAVGRESGYLVEVDHALFGEHERLAPLVRFSRSATQALPGVLAGSATDRVLEELGYDAEEVADLRERDVVR